MQAAQHGYEIILAAVDFTRKRAAKVEAEAAQAAGRAADTLARSKKVAERAQRLRADVPSAVLEDWMMSAFTKDRGAEDRAFLDQYTVGAERVLDYVRGTVDGVAKTPAWASEKTARSMSAFISVATRALKTVHRYDSSRKVVRARGTNRLVRVKA